MPNRKRWIALLGVLAFFATGMWLACPADQPVKVQSGVRPFMRMKLEASSNILEGLTTEDFRMIREGAETLHKMSGAEKCASAMTCSTGSIAEFNHEAERLLDQANHRNLDGATLAWVECSMSCVRCHKHVRTIKITDR